MASGAEALSWAIDLPGRYRAFVPATTPPWRIHLGIYPGALEAELQLQNERVSYVDSLRSKDPVAPLVLIHGSGGTAASHFGTIYPMFANRRRVIAVEYGDPAADQSVPLTLDFLVDKVRLVLDKLVDGSPVDLVGYSLGAAVAIRLAATDPARVRTLTSVAGWLRSDPHQQLRNSTWQSLHEQADETLSKFSVLNAYGAPYLAKRTPAEIHALVSKSRPGPDRLRQMQLNADLDVTESALEVEAPTLVVSARYDQMAPVHHSRGILGAIPNARLATVHSGHAIFSERPAEVFQLIDEFTLDPEAHPAGTTIPHLTI